MGVVGGDSAEKNVLTPYKEMVSDMVPNVKMVRRRNHQLPPVELLIDVRVAIRSKPDLGAGRVKYIGPVEGLSGDWVGVELELPRGKTDGTIKGQQLFVCHPKHGIYAPLEDIAHPDDVDNLAKPDREDTAAKDKWKFFCCQLM